MFDILGAFTLARKQLGRLTDFSWLRHSRQIRGWGGDADPERAWVAHVRGVLGAAR